MANWFHRFFNPHCEHCAEERRENRICSSCEVLQNEIARLRHDNARLLDRVTREPIVQNERTEAPLPNVPLTARMPWKVQQQRLEHKDREMAQAIKLTKAAPKPIDVNEMEKEMNIVQSEREAKSGA